MSSGHATAGGALCRVMNGGGIFWMAISSLVATRNLHGCGAREPLDLIAGKCAQSIAGAAASGSRGTSCVASGGRRAADETGGLWRILRGTGLKTSRVENILSRRGRDLDEQPLSQSSPLSQNSPEWRTSDSGQEHFS